MEPGRRRRLGFTRRTPTLGHRPQARVAAPPIVSAYRFCRTDDIALLVEALNHCGGSLRHDGAPMDVASFKRAIRTLQLWCSSCMVAFEGSEPIGVLIGCKRPTGSLILRIDVHPDHRRRGHARHMLTSLKDKLKILGPPKLIAEIPSENDAARALFAGCGFSAEAELVDLWIDSNSDATRLGPTDPDGLVTIPTSVEDLEANGLLETLGGDCWARDPLTLQARKAEIEGVALASSEGLAAFALYAPADLLAPNQLYAIVCAQDEHATPDLRRLLGSAAAKFGSPLLLPKATAGELAQLAASHSSRQGTRYTRVIATAS